MLKGKDMFFVEILRLFKFKSGKKDLGQAISPDRTWEFTRQ